MKKKKRRNSAYNIIHTSNFLSEYLNTNTRIEKNLVYNVLYQFQEATRRSITKATQIHGEVSNYRSNTVIARNYFDNLRKKAQKK